MIIILDQKYNKKDQYPNIGLVYFSFPYKNKGTKVIIFAQKVLKTNKNKEG